MLRLASFFFFLCERRKRFAQKKKKKIINKTPAPGYNVSHTLSINMRYAPAKKMIKVPLLATKVFFFFLWTSVLRDKEIQIEMRKIKKIKRVGGGGDIVNQKQKQKP